MGQRAVRASADDFSDVRDPAPAVNDLYDDHTAEYKPEHGYHQINVHYPGVQLIHKQPNVFIVNHFLSADICRRLLDKAGPKMKKSMAQLRSGQRMESAVRTSQHLWLWHAEVPSIVRRMEAMLDIPKEHCACFKLLRYSKGEFFKRHKDAFSGVSTDKPSGFIDSNRILTLLVYLNDVRAGGDTVLTDLQPPLRVRPQAGMGFVMLTGTLDCEPDNRLYHEGCEAIDEKWVLSCQIWHAKSIDYGGVVRTSKIQTLSDDII